MTELAAPANKLSTESESARALLSGALVTLVAFGALYAVEPHLDVVVAKQFYSGTHGFSGSSAGIGALRTAFKGAYVISCLLAVGGLVASLVYGRRIRGLSTAKWAYLCACLAIGPGIVCNLALKDEWGRARPRDIVEFGGNLTFTSPLMPSDQCKTNCSFTCGEASSIYMIFFALGLLARRRSGQLVAAGILFGSIAGAVRITQGGHFLSDVIFAGVTMALVASVLHLLLDSFDHPEKLESHALA